MVLRYGKDLRVGQWIWWGLSLCEILKIENTKDAFGEGEILMILKWPSGEEIEYTIQEYQKFGVEE